MIRIRDSWLIMIHQSICPLITILMSISLQKVVMVEQVKRKERKRRRRLVPLKKRASPRKMYKKKVAKSCTLRIQMSNNN